MVGVPFDTSLPQPFPWPVLCLAAARQGISVLCNSSGYNALLITSRKQILRQTAQLLFSFKWTV